MNSHTPYTPDHLFIDKRQRLDDHYAQVEGIILARQDPITGLLPASTAITVHGDYTHAWVRDNVYSILAVWGLALAYRRQDDDAGRAYRLEQSVVKLMRGLLVAMMRQSAKVERFKSTQNPLDALHAKYDTRSGEPVVGDDQWGHLQLDATALFLLMLAQMTASGLRIVFTPEEVDFVQNLVHYLSRAYLTPDYGIWERGHKMNDGLAEINASSLGIVKAALEALRGFNLYGRHGGPDSVIHVVPDDIARARSTLEALLPRESNSKEIDAALLAVIGYPAFAVEDAALVQRTRDEIIGKLQGRYGCKRFLRDGHQTVLEDHGRLHYEAGELKQFEDIESEWPLFFTYLLLDGALRNDPEQAQDYRQRLEGLLVERDGQRLLPELYYVPAEAVAAEKAAPHSQDRLPNENVPLVWAQSLFVLGALLQEGFIEPADVDPLGRRLQVGQSRDTRVQVMVLAEDAAVQATLDGLGIISQTRQDIAPVQVRQADALAGVFAGLGGNPRLALSGRPPRRLDVLTTCEVYSRCGETLVFLPDFLDRSGFYLNRDNYLWVERVKAELTYIRRHWDRPGRPLLVLPVSAAMLQSGGHETLLALLQELHSGQCNGVPVQVAPLAEHLPTVTPVSLDRLCGRGLKDSAGTAPGSDGELPPWD
nr:glycoside hydrolase family 15 protein [Pseudomonadota bacterium]